MKSRFSIFLTITIVLSATAASLAKAQNNVDEWMALLQKNNPEGASHVLYNAEQVADYARSDAKIPEAWLKDLKSLTRREAVVAFQLDIVKEFKEKGPRTMGQDAVEAIPAGIALGGLAFVWNQFLTAGTTFRPKAPSCRSLMREAVEGIPVVALLVAGANVFLQANGHPFRKAEYESKLNSMSSDERATEEKNLLAEQSSIKTRLESLNANIEAIREQAANQARLDSIKRQFVQAREMGAI